MSEGCGHGCGHGCDQGCGHGSTINVKWYTPCTHHVHTMYTPCTHHVQTMYTPCTDHVHTIYTQCTDHVVHGRWPSSTLHCCCLFFHCVVPRESSHTDTIIDRQADTIRYLQQHNASLAKKILQLQQDDNNRFDANSLICSKYLLTSQAL